MRYFSSQLNRFPAVGQLRRRPDFWLAAVRPRERFADAPNWEEEWLLAMKDVQQKDDAFFTVVGQEYGFYIGKRTVGDDYALAGLEIRHAGLIDSQSMSDPFDDSIVDGQQALVTMNELRHSARRADAVPVVVDLIELDENVAREHRLLHRDPAALPELLHL